MQFLIERANVGMAILIKAGTVGDCFQLRPGKIVCLLAVHYMNEILAPAHNARECGVGGCAAGLDDMQK